MKKYSFLLFAICLIIASCGSQKKMAEKDNKPKPETTVSTDTTNEKVNITMPAKDLRAVWIATIGGLDWPRGHFDEKSQKDFYIQYLDTLQKLNINTIFFQVRPRADAFYESEFEPWSMYLTWRRNQNPGYDVLRWLIDETHRRGMSFHAWMNPYRIGTRNGRRDKFAQLDSRIPKELVKDYANVRIYNPALPETRQRICDIVADLLKRYDVDGIHFDDYFYPALVKGERMNDMKEYKKYGNEYSSIEDFRRAMVDSLVVSVHRTIRAARPNVVFSISPQGNYRNNYEMMFADVEQWSQKGWCDVIIPQLYWSTGSYFPGRLKWFANHCTADSKLAIGYALYRFDGKSRDPYFKNSDDLARQFEYADSDKRVSGSALYSAHWLIDNPLNINKVIAKQNAHLCLPPYLGHQPEARPDGPEAVAAVISGDSLQLSWQPVSECYYAVYSAADADSPAELVAVTYGTSVKVAPKGRYFVTAVRKGDNAESLPVAALAAK